MLGGVRAPRPPLLRLCQQLVDTRPTAVTVSGRAHQPDVSSWESIRFPKLTQSDVLRGPLSYTAYLSQLFDRFLEADVCPEQVRVRDHRGRHG